MARVNTVLYTISSISIISYANETNIRKKRLEPEQKAPFFQNPMVRTTPCLEYLYSFDAVPAVRSGVLINLLSLFPHALRLRVPVLKGLCCTTGGLAAPIPQIRGVWIRTWGNAIHQSLAGQFRTLPLLVPFFFSHTALRERAWHGLCYCNRAHFTCGGKKSIKAGRGHSKWESSSMTYIDNSSPPQHFKLRKI
ncbi:hypothetical protein L873DRAFT_258582 [Choiromyces venosus 120613-1]|uniref:Uncharacterized protein n=1 Tax=Choiromyces venosus 120613-1 TaxID=1336337 RepID=A0A3N4J0R8_9PEZI|nr:hypothetical protein L873DRAFT_258582 [Choiromyces venosus 120613-1]